MTKQTARQTVVEALLQVNHKGGYSNVVLNHLLKQNALSPQDSAFAGILLYGVLERKLTLDYVIGKYAAKSLKSIQPEVLEILRVSLYQLLYLDGVPESAAVNEGVNLSKAFRVGGASGFINAVLRGFIRDGKKIPPSKGNRLAKMEIRYSCPQWIIKTFLESYGEEATLSLLAHSLGRPPLYARVNRAKISANALLETLRAQGVGAEPDPSLEDCLILSGTASLEGMPAFQEGLFHIQDKSSQLCAAAVGAKAGERVLDLCSAPGSKAFTIAQRMKDQGEIMACDILPEKVNRIRAGAKRLGLTSLVPLCSDGTVFHPELGSFDRVLCDVPCSGLGIIGRKPEIKYKNQHDLQGLAKTQQGILEASAGYVKPGGRLVYSTCTLLPGENQAVVERFLAKNKAFAPCPLEQEVLEAVGKGEERLCSLTLLPDMAETDGFFMASMERIG